MRLKSSKLLGFGHYTVEVKNTTKGIELSNIEEHGRSPLLNRADQIRNDLLIPFVRPYSKFTVHEKEGRKLLEKQLIEDIAAYESEIKKMKLAIQMCRKNKVTLIK